MLGRLVMELFGSKTITFLRLSGALAKVLVFSKILYNFFSEGEFTLIGFSFTFIRFLYGFSSPRKSYALFRTHFYMSISALTRLSHIGQKFFIKRNFLKDVQYTTVLF